MFTLIFLSLIVAAWLALGSGSWLVWSVATRGHAGLGTLPLCMFAAVVAGLSVPLLGKDDEWGMVLSGLASLAAPNLLLVARRFADQGRPGSMVQ